MVRRVFCEKMMKFSLEANEIKNDLVDNLGISELSGLRVLQRYDVEGIDENTYIKAKKIVFSEPATDICYDEEVNNIPDNAKVFATEYLPGQYDQRADSACQCIQLISPGESPKVKCARIFILEGTLNHNIFSKIKAYLINPVEAREASLEKPKTLFDEVAVPGDIDIINGFTNASDDEIEAIRKQYSLAMDTDDIKFCRQYFKDEEKRNPTVTEIRMIDTYWSDHCRHTTFLTEIKNVEFRDCFDIDIIRETYNEYLKDREELYAGKNKPVCLMDLATVAMKKLKKDGRLPLLDISEEINACSIEIDADISGKNEKWLVMFKNETHNHPTEIEPFGGAATCLGGAIRDPLSGRSYVYQAMRITGSSDPTVPIEKTLEGKLPQKKITTGAAAGYSSYGNQIGLATGKVDEIYHPGYVAKRMEIGAVIGAAPKSMVVRELPRAGDTIILLGGKTGRDGCGGATGSSKAHTDKSLETSGAEVQKGNAPSERKIQRLFRNEKVTKLIKRCNDFGAGGVSVAVGELADGLKINLDLVPKKYEGLNGTELAISESQERMAVVIAKNDVAAFMALAAEENLEATEIAAVTEEPRLVMQWRGKTIVSVSREFLNSNGASKTANAEVKGANNDFYTKKDFTKESLKKELASLNNCSKKGLASRFDASIGAATVLMPFGGKNQLTPTEGMAAKLPVLKGDTKTCTVMTYGINPYLMKWSPFHGSLYAVLESVSRMAASGAPVDNVYLTFQEYFERLENDKTRWGKPFAALLGAYYAQKRLGMAAIGGKDSMSGSFNGIDVPPTLASFAVSAANTDTIISPEFKKAKNRVVLFETVKKGNMLIDFEHLKKLYKKIHEYIKEGKIISASAVKGGGIAVSLCEMCFGNDLGIEIDKSFKNDMFYPDYGSIIAEVSENFAGDAKLIGFVTEKAAFTSSTFEISLLELKTPWQNTLEGVFRQNPSGGESGQIEPAFCYDKIKVLPKGIAKPRVFIPVFPGTNCEYDTKRAFERVGGDGDIFVIKNQTAGDIADSIKELAKKIAQSQILMLPGGFSAGDEPDGSGKFIAAIFRNEHVKEAVYKHLNQNDGLILGICNGFQALIKLGLVPFGEIRDMDENCPTLTYNTIGRHISVMADTMVVSAKSPWLTYVSPGDIYTVAVSHGEGNFVCSQELYEKLVKSGQIASQYVDKNGTPTYDINYNPNGSYMAVEGLLSPCGRVFGKMGHSERSGGDLYKNISGNLYQPIFEAGIDYFK